jgi:hypothetical protein
MENNIYDWDLNLKLPFINIANDGNPCYQENDNNLGLCSKSDVNDEQIKCNIYGREKEISCQNIEDDLPSDISGQVKVYLTKLRSELQSEYENKSKEFGVIDKELTYIIKELKNKYDFREISSKLGENNIKLMNQSENDIENDKKSLNKKLNKNELDFLTFHQKKFEIEKNSKRIPLIQKIVFGLFIVWISLLIFSYLLIEIQKY